MAGLRNRLGSVFRRYRGLSIRTAGVAAAAAVLAAAFSPASPLGRLDALVFDAYQNISPREPAGSPVTVVDIDDGSLAALGQWPWPRTVLARMVEQLTGMGAAAIGLDLLLAEPDRTSPSLALAELRRQGFTVVEPASGAILDNDEYLARVFAAAPVVSGLALAETTRTAPPPPKAGFGFGGADPVSYLAAYEGSIHNLDAFDESAAGIGLINFPPARDGIVREIPLIARHGQTLYPALALEALRVAQGASTYLIRSTGAHGEHDAGNPGMVAVKAGNYEVPTGPDGAIQVYYSAAPVAKVIPARRLADQKPDPAVAEAVAGHIVLIGTSAVGLRDLVSTPLAAAVPGVFVHAEIIDQIIGGTFLHRPDWATGAEVALAATLALLVAAFLPRLPSMANALVAANAITASVAAGWLAFSEYRLLLSPILPVLCSLFAYGIGSGMRLLASESERRYIRNAFSQYLAPAMVEQLVEHPERLVLGGEDRELTILFCDVRGFTRLSEKLGPTAVTEFLNGFLTPMTEVLLKNGATIDKYMGDAIMAFWNAPIDVADHRRRACASVLEMQEALSGFNRRTGYEVSIGIGLNTGFCCVGNLGSRQRFDYSAIGDPVNVASRVEGMTKRYGLANLVSDSTAGGAEGFALLEIDRIRLLGRTRPTTVFTVLGDEGHAAGAGFRRLRDLQASFLARYRARSFVEAQQDLEALRAAAPPLLQPYCTMMDERLRHLLREPPPGGWDGSFEALEK